MKKISKENSYDIVLDDRCIAKEYDFKDNDIDFSTTYINGRYPMRGYCVNEKVKELIYILQGTGSIHIKDKKFDFLQGDALLIDKNEAYYWDEKCNCKVAMICTPAWYEEQHKIIEQ